MFIFQADDLSRTPSNRLEESCISDGPNDKSDCTDERIDLKDISKDLNGEESFVNLSNTKQDHRIDHLNPINALIWQGF